jgi:hypothetical protein
MLDCLRRFTRITNVFQLAAFACIGCFILSTSGYLLAASDIAPVVVATIDTGRHLGGGANLSPDGQSLVYVAADGLHLRDLATNKDTLLQREVEFGNAVFDSPTLTPNGKYVLVSVSGGTWYYPSDIYSIGIDGSGPTKLTTSTPTASKDRGAAYRRYFYSAMMSPKSSDILVWVYDATASKSNGGIIEGGSFDSSGLAHGPVRVIAQGEPLAWSNDGRSFYQSSGNKVIRYYVGSRETTESVISGKVVGKIYGSETLAIDDGKRIYFVDMDSDREVAGNVVFPRSEFVATKTSSREELTLKRVQSIATGLTLLIYRGPTTERIELVKADFSR